MDSIDRDLVAGARRGEEAAYHAIVDRYGSYLYRFAFSLVGNGPDAEDVVQETLAAAFRQVGRFEGRASIKTWLTSILVRQAARFHRYRGIRKMLSLNGLRGTVREPKSGSRGGRSGENVAMSIDIQDALEALSPAHREVVVLREIHGMTYEEIAAALGVPTGTVESRLFRARRALQERLRDYLD